MKIVTDQAKIEEIFNRGMVAEVLPSKKELFDRLAKGERLKIYFGLDPTADALHLGHAQNLMFLEDLRQLGHKVIVLFGDFTAQIGDPSGRAVARPQLSEEQVKENVKGWMSQIKPLINFSDQENPPQVLLNSEWLAKLSLKDVISLAANFTVQQMIERDMFEKRWQTHQPIYLHEFLYPLMQGYDSVAIEVDAELCGTDQIFNALSGRTLLKRMKNKNKFVIALNLLANPQTGELMSKSRGAGVFLSSLPSEMYGAIMAMPDEVIEPLFISCTRLPLMEKEKIMLGGARTAKARVAFEIVRKIHGDDAARVAEKTFDQTFRDGGVPENIPIINLSPGANLVEALVASGVVDSKGGWRRLINEGAVRDGENKKISEPYFIPAETMILKIGKHRFVKIVVR